MDWVIVFNAYLLQKGQKMTIRHPRSWIAIGMALGFAGSAHAQSVYLGAGFLGLQGGYAHRINDNWGARADVMFVGSAKDTLTESGTTFSAKVAWNRVSALADWHPSKNSGFRVTAGISANDMGSVLTAAGAGASVDINNTVYVLTNNDSLTIKAKMPSTTPYVGFGYGHHANQKGLGFYADLGLLLGGLKVTETRTGALTSVSQADMDAELKEIRDALGKFKVFPQLTLGLTYRF